MELQRLQQYDSRQRDRKSVDAAKRRVFVDIEEIEISKLFKKAQVDPKNLFALLIDVGLNLLSI